jgi:hypothetical protein
MNNISILEKFDLNYYVLYSYHIEGEKIKEKINDNNNFFEFYLSDILDKENYPIIRYSHDLGKHHFNQNEIEFLANESFLRIKRVFKDYPELLI